MICFGLLGLGPWAWAPGPSRAFTGAGPAGGMCQENRSVPRLRLYAPHMNDSCSATAGGKQERKAAEQRFHRDARRDPPRRKSLRAFPLTSHSLRRAHALLLRAV